MTANQRIAVNFLATYGRSLYKLALGLLCGRWTLLALGETDCGLLGLVGGLTIFVSFLNSLMASAVCRFFARAVGEAQRQENGGGLEDCRRWFNIALTIHTVLPAALLAVGYPAGVWALGHFLTIPNDRVAECLWVWRFVCASCFIGMVTVPFMAIYHARQYIAELTAYTFVTATLNAGFLYYMITHPGAWLVRMAAWGCLLSVTPNVLIAIRAVRLFPECRLVRRYLWDAGRFGEVFTYAFYSFFGMLSMMIRRQGVNILINKYLGPSRNASVTVAETVSEHCNGLASSFLVALFPAIQTAYAAGDRERVLTLCSAVCKGAAIMVLIFILPLFLEAQEVFRLWLVRPPEGAVPLCLCLLAVLAMDNLTCGLHMSVYADGRIRGYQLSILGCGVMAVTLAWAALALGHGVASVGGALVVAHAFAGLASLHFARTICRLPIARWLSGTALPVVAISLLSLAAGFGVRYALEPSLPRIAATAVTTNAVFLPLAYAFVLGATERKYIAEKLRKFLSSDEKFPQYGVRTVC